MAGRRLTITSGELASGTAAKTLLQLLAPADAWLEPVSARIFFGGTNAAHAAHRIQLMKQTTAGTGGSAVTPAKILKADTDTVRSSALKDISSAEPTYGDVLDEVWVDPNKGFYLWNFAQLGFLQLKAGERLAIVDLDPNGNDTPVTVSMDYVE